MGTKLGSSSSLEPHRASADYATNLLVLFGILVSLVFIGGSALLNYRMGYASADNRADGTVYGSLAAAGDGLKALSPFVVGYGWRHRDWLATIAATIVFITFTAYSFTSSLGFSSQHRAHKQGIAAAAIEHHQDARRTIDRDQLRLDALGPQRSSMEVTQDIANQLSAPVGSGRWTVDQVSEGCTRNKPLTREVCTRVASLKEEQARANEAERLASEIKNLTASSKSALVVQSTDPQTDALSFLVRIFNLQPAETSTADEGKRVGFGLALLMAIFIELGSGFGLYIVTTPWRGRHQKPQPIKLHSPPLPAMTNGPPLEAFAAERLERMPGCELHLALAFEVYKEWCEQRHRTTQGRTRFERGLLKLAKELGLEVESDLSGWVVHDVALRNISRRLR